MSETELPAEMQDAGNELDEDDRLKPEFVRSVLDAVEAGDSPLAARELDIRQVRAALGRLETLGLIRRDGLGGYERTGVPCARA